ncbi:transcriptional regulator ATRX [Phytophthora infestans T30-4]|uniref:Transcriptional regulator ATRX n=2 Tax=Phytophthora infestans TaxID=4787 RepID=D0NIX3_PHYIT|nr:transcriptional regulator ATRX [Phytophthora infestans T30-4]EEY59457.1 transcriptional regulator ATRX [Phytophthora infestans T30-4]KAF4032614.1 Helicase conserved C-terminal domain [Phytophthora infestans]KAF4142369.1 Helicase conserved C-terminal domain [Phytophthora infestans]|eukprot:XP_002901067.1 transcriptional regulator ATRX [Phytophthora infestans T30-4]
MSSADEIEILTDDEQAAATHSSDEIEAEWDPNAPVDVEEDEEESDGVDRVDFDEDDEEAQDGSIISFFQPRRSSRSSSNGKKKKDTGKKRKAQPSERTERAERWNRRRKIADVMDDEDLDESTRRAREAEAKRAKKIDAILGNFSNLSEDQLAVPDEQQEDLLCLNPLSTDGTPPTGEEGTEDAPIFVYKDLVDKLKPHQVIGAKFLWSHVAQEPVGFGCVLADFMGLGKTLQVITTVQAFLSKKTLNGDGRLEQRHKHVLILAPTICVRNWEAEVVKWLGKKESRRLGLFTLESSREKKMSDRVNVVKLWHKRGGLLITGYELYRLLVLQSSGEEKIAPGNQKYSHMIKQAYKCLCDPGPDLMVLDEGHRVRNHKSKLVKALAHVKTTRRIILTGYPLQNHLEEYWTMVNFARPDYLGSLDEFKNRFVAPIKNGQCIDSSDADLKLARQRAFVLTRELKPLVLRRDQQYLFKQLPPKKEYVLMCKLTDAQAQLYRDFLKYGVPTRGNSDRLDVLGGYHIALAISNHPDVISETYKRLEEEERSGNSKKSSRRGVSDIFGVEDGGDDFDSYDDVPTSRQVRRASPSPPTRGPPVVDDDDDDDDGDEANLLSMLDAPSAASTPKPPKTSDAGWHRLKFAKNFMEKYVPHQLEASGKMMILMELLSACQDVGDRVIIFSQSIPTLDTIGLMISKHNKYQRRHSKRLNYLRIDGSTSQQDRFRQIAQFNDLEEDIDLIMISTKAGGEGINLCAGNRIIIFDVCWNPCNDSQSMCRSYRFGQTKPVFVYRFVTMGTMEKKVYDLQIRKEGVAKRIVDEKTTERKFMTSELQKYFSIDDFEESLLHAQGKAADAEELAIQAIPHEDSVLESILTDMRDRSTTAVANENGDITAAGMLTDRRCIIDWFEQETMFEEDLDQQCSPAEQKEILETHMYFKAVRTLRRGGTHLISRDGMLMKHCDNCRAPNEIYPSSTTKVPVPTRIECTYCRRPTSTTGAVPPSELQVPSFMNRMPGVAMPAVGVIPSTTVVPGRPPVAPGAQTSRVLPPNLQAIFDQQQGNSKLTENEKLELLIRHRVEQERLKADQQRKQAEAQAKLRMQERMNMKLKERHLLVLRRGIKGCQDLKRKAEECGATLAIEVNPQLTDIVSGVSIAETLKWLKLNKLPGDVDMHDDIWLRNEIAKEKGLPLIPTKSTAAMPQPAPEIESKVPIPSTPLPTTTTKDQSPQTTVDSNSDFIELLDSDDEDAAKPATIEQTPGTNGVVSQTAVPDEADVIEIL